MSTNKKCMSPDTHTTHPPWLSLIHCNEPVMLTHSLGDDASQKDLIFAMLLSSGDGSGNIKADWQKVEDIMSSWGYGFTAGAMCKSAHPDLRTYAFAIPTLCHPRLV